MIARRALLALGALIALGGGARADQTWTQPVHANSQPFDGLAAPAKTTSPVRPADMPGAGLPCPLVYTGTLGSLFRCATPADIPGATGTPNTMAWFNGSGLLNSLTLDGSLVLSGSTFQRGALNGAVTAAAGSNTTAFGSFPAFTVLANAGSSSGVPAPLAAGSDGIVLGKFAGALTFHQLLEADVLNLSTDLAARVPTNRTLTMTPPLLCDGASSCDLSANRTFSIAAAAADQVANVSALEALPAANYHDGSRVRVTSLNDDFFFHATSSLTVDHIAVASASGASGSRWIRREGGRRADWGTTYFIDPTSGNDQNDGLTSGTALKTGAELKRRTDGSDTNAAVTVTPLGEMPDSDPLVFNVSPGGGAFSLTIAGAPTVAASGVVASAVAANYTTNQLNQVTITGFNWAPYVGSLVRLQGTSGNSGTYAAVVSNLGSGTALLGVRVVNQSPGTTSFSAGQTIEVLAYPKISGLISAGARPLNVVLQEVRVANTAAILLSSPSTGSTLNLQRAVVDGGGTSSLTSTFGQVSMTTSSIRSTTGVSVRALNLGSGSALVNAGQVSFTTNAAASPAIWADSITWASPVNFGDLADVQAVTRVSPSVGVGVFGLTSSQIGLQVGRSAEINAEPLFGANNDPGSWVLGLSRTAKFTNSNLSQMFETSSAGALVGYINPAAATGAGGQSVPLSHLQAIFTAGGLDKGAGPTVASTTSLAPLGLTMFRVWTVTGSTPIESITRVNTPNGVQTVNQGYSIELIVQDGTQFVHSAAAASGFAPLILADGANETLPAGSRIRFEFDSGLDWRETWRSTVGGPALAGSLPNPTFAPIAGLSALGTATTSAAAPAAITCPATAFRFIGTNGSANGMACEQIPYSAILGAPGSPTGTGFTHVTGSVTDGAARAVDLSTADATGTLAAGRFPALTGPVTTTAGSLATALNLGSGGISGSLPLGNQAAPTGTGFPHITAGTWDGAARAVDLSSADATGTLAAARAPAYTGPVTTSAGSLVTALNLSATGISGALPLADLAQGGATTNQVLAWSGSVWAPSTVSTAPSGPAGGGLTGTYPNPSIATGVIVPGNFSAFGADTVLCNDQGVSATPRLCTLGTGLSFDATAHQIFSTVAGGAPSGATYWVKDGTSLPANAIRMDTIGNGVVIDTGGTPSVFAAGSDQMVFGAASGGGLQSMSLWTVNPSTQAITGSAPISLQGATTTIGAWNGIGKFTAGVVGVATAGTDYVHSVSGTAGQIANTGTAADPVLALPGVGSSGACTYCNLTFDAQGRETSRSSGAWPAVNQIVVSNGGAPTGFSNLKFDGSNLFLPITGASFLGTDITGKVVANTSNVVTSATAPLQDIAGVVSINGADIDSPLTLSGGHLGVSIPTGVLEGSAGSLTSFSVPAGQYVFGASSGGGLASSAAFTAVLGGAQMRGTSASILLDASSFFELDTLTPNAIVAGDSGRALTSVTVDAPLTYASKHLGISSPPAQSITWSQSFANSSTGLLSGMGNILFPSGDLGTIGASNTVYTTVSSQVAATLNANLGTSSFPIGHMAVRAMTGGTLACADYFGSSSGSGTDTENFVLYQSTDLNVYTGVASLTVNNWGSLLGSIGRTNFTVNIPAGAYLFLAVFRSDAATGKSVVVMNYRCDVALY